MTMRPGGNTPWHFKSFFRKPGLAQAIDNDRWGRRLGQKPFDCELRVETTRLRQSQFRLGVVPFRGLSSRQIWCRKNRSGIPRKWHA